METNLNDWNWTGEIEISLIYQNGDGDSYSEHDSYYLNIDDAIKRLEKLKELKGV